MGMRHARDMTINLYEQLWTEMGAFYLPMSVFYSMDYKWEAVGRRNCITSLALPRF